MGCPVVIMAGGKGERLDPFTRLLPKPLMPIEKKPMIELVMDQFHKFGFCPFYLVVNYKGDMIKMYFDSADIDYKIEYIWETEFLGTAGSLSLLYDQIPSTFIVSNCDVIVNTNFSELMNFHCKNESAMTVIGAKYSYVVPYGVISAPDAVVIKEISEKPQVEFVINTGVYVLQKEVLDLITPNQVFDMTDLMQKMIQENVKLCLYSIREDTYLDIGQWKEYKKNYKLLSQL